jgi:predicted O-methyltransferase YrrM
MIKFQRRIVDFLFRIILKFRSKDVSLRLYNGTDKHVNLLVEALRETVNNDVDSREKLLLDKIELIREKLLFTKSSISILDYGAGSSNSNLSDEEMYRGRAVNRTIRDICKNSCKSYLWSLFLFKLIRKFQPGTCIELGTCLGISAAYQATALNLNGNGKIITLEGAEKLASISEENFRELYLDNVKVVKGRFQDTIETVLKTYSSIDYVYIDGHHEERATLSYFYKIVPYLSPGALLILDDISWSKGMKRAWNIIKSDNRVATAINLQQMGVCIVNNKTNNKKIHSANGVLAYN